MHAAWDGLRCGCDAFWRVQVVLEGGVEMDWALLWHARCVRRDTGVNPNVEICNLAFGDWHLWEAVGAIFGDAAKQLTVVDVVGIEW